MSDSPRFLLKTRNPDVLTCIANISNDEVATPPSFAKEMLDGLATVWSKDNKGADIWSDSTIKFLDPCTKSGVFLREIVERLSIGLASEFPDLQERINHILLNQVFGIGITRLTSLMARRSIYCSKSANGKHSVGNEVFDSADGNIWFERTEHEWTGGRPVVSTDIKRRRGQPETVGGKCKYCRANQIILQRESGLETHAYAFIHTDDISAQMQRIFGDNMQFDVIIGNPPYQLSDGGHSASATPIYHKFIEQAMALDPRYISMVTPSRWFIGGKGLDGFRAKMLSDDRLRVIVDFIVDKDAFPKINVNGGVNYFLWSRDSPGECEITTVESGGVRGKPSVRPLNEFDVFVRRNTAVTILRKVQAKQEDTFDLNVSPRKPFGLPTNFFGGETETKTRNIKLYSSGQITWVAQSAIEVRPEWIKEWKVMIPAATDGNENYPLPIWDTTGPFIARPGEACTETYLIASITKTKREAEFVVAYMRTRFFRFLVSLRKVAQHNKIENFSFVPIIPMDRVWTDEELYERYGITKNEVLFIESMIRAMD